MWETYQRIARLVIIFFGALTVVAGVTTYWLTIEAKPPASHFQSLGLVQAYIQEHGLTPEVQEHLEALPKHKAWIATFVVEESGVDTGRIVAATPRELIGKVLGDFTGQYSHLAGTGPNGWGAPVEAAADGMSYTVWTWHLLHDYFWKSFWTAVAFVSLVITWLASCIWLALDARGRSATAVAGWVFLCLLTGPIAVAVWLISRPSPRQPEICPGCGATAVPDATYCVQCGHGLKPACPNCCKVVAAEWTYCPACRTNLVEE